MRVEKQRELLQSVMRHTIRTIMLMCLLVLAPTLKVHATEPEYRISEVALKAGTPITISGVETGTGATYKWYVDDVLTSDEESYTPSTDDYEKWIKVEVLVDGDVVWDETRYFSKLPVMYINTDDGNPVTTKEYYVSASMTMQGNDLYDNEKYLYGAAEGSTDVIQIKGRGNSTWLLPKKPYKIKLDKKTSLCNLGSANKHWVLLANYHDESNMRNKIAYDFSKELGLNVSMNSTWVTLIFNSEYSGVYQLCEQIKIANGRVDIHDWESEAEDNAKAIAESKYPDKKDKDIRKAFQSDLEDFMVENLSWITTGTVYYQGTEYSIPGWDGADISGGYLFEIDEGYDDISKFKTKSGLKIMMKSPEYLNSNSEMFQYVQDYWNAFENSYRAEDGYNIVSGQHYSHYASMESMIQYWLLHEMMGNYDSHRRSRFAYKNQDEQMFFGPVWDFDVGLRTPDSSRWTISFNSSDQNFFKDWTDDPVFLLTARKLYWQKHDAYERLFCEGGWIDQYAEYLKEARKTNMTTWYNGESASGEDTSVTILKDYLKKRCSWLDAQFATLDTITASLYTANSAYPFKKSDDIKVMYSSACPTKCILNPIIIDGMTSDYYLPESIDLSLSLQTADSASEIEICIDGIRYGFFDVANGKVDVTIPRDKLKLGDGEMSIITMFAHDADGNPLGRNYFTISADNELPVVTSEPVVSANLTYNGSPQTLMTDGIAENGSFLYAMTTENVEPAKSAFASSIPTATDAGTYYLWYYLAGTSGFKDLEIKGVEATIDIAEAPSASDIPSTQKPASAINLHYNGELQDLITVPTTLPAAYNEIWYSLDGADFTKSVPQAKNAGDYTVKVKFVDSYNNTKELILDNITVTIAKALAPTSITADHKPSFKPAIDLVYTGQDIELIDAPSSLPDNYDKIFYSLSVDSWSEEIPTGLNAGNYVIKTKYVDTDGNYEGLFIEDITVSISKKTYDDDSSFPVDRKPAAKSDLRYTGNLQELITAPLTPPDFYTIQYSLEGQDYSAELPLGSAVGTYAVNVMYVPTDSDNYEAFNGVAINVSIEKALPPEVDSLSADEVPTLIDEVKLVYTGEAITPIIAPDKLPQGYTGILYSLDGGDTLTEEIPTVVNAGNYVIKVKYVDSSECHEDFYGSDISFVIGKAQGPVQKDITVDISAAGTDNGLIDVRECLEENYRIKSIVVDGNLKDVLTIVGSDLDEDGYLHYSLLKTEANKESSIVLSLESDNYTDYSIAIIVTTKAKITEGGLVVKGVHNLAYTGSALTQPELKVYSNKDLLEEGTDYTLTYKNNTNAGTASVVVKGIGNYRGTQEDTFQILPISIAGEAFDADDLYLISTGKNQKKTPVLYKDGKILAAQNNYSVGYYVEGTTVDTLDPQVTKSYSTSYVMILTGKGNYTGKRAVKVVILPKEQTTLVSALKVSLSKKTFTLLKDKNENGAVEPMVTVKKGKTVYEAGKDYTVSYQSNSKVGTGYVLVTGIGKLSGTKRVSFTIKGTSISKAEVEGIKVKTFDPTYNSDYIQDGYTVTVNGKSLVKGVDFTEKYTGNTKAGNATLVIKGVGDYSGTKRVPFIIQKASLTTDDAKCEESVAYNKGGAKATVTVTKNGIALVEGKDYKVTYKSNLKVTDSATAQAQIKGIGNYSGTVNLKFKVNTAVIKDQDGSLEMTAAGKRFSGDNKAKVSSLLAKPKLIDAVSLKGLVSGTDYAAVCKYEIAGSSDGTFREITEEDRGKKANDFLTEVFGKDYSISSKGVYIKVTATLKGNYSGSYSTVYRVSPALISSAKYSVKAQDYTGMAVVFDPASKTFASDFKIYIGESTKKGTALVYGVDYEIVEGSYKNNVKKGTATVKIRGIGKYAGEKTVRFQIKAKKL